jgi:plasmid stability protein
MPSLQVDNIPKELYEGISIMAVSEERSIEQETILLLQTALNIRKQRAERLKKAFDDINEINRHIKKDNDFLNHVDLIREDRDNR